MQWYNAISVSVENDHKWKPNQWNQQEPRTRCKNCVFQKSDHKLALFHIRVPYSTNKKLVQHLFVNTIVWCCSNYYNYQSIVIIIIFYKQFQLPVSSSKEPSIDIVMGVFKALAFSCKLFMEDFREFVVEFSLSSFWVDWSFSIFKYESTVLLFFVMKYFQY